MNIVKTLLRSRIIKKIAEKKSLWGLAAREVEGTEQEEELIKIMCEEAHIKSFQEHLGKELFDDLIKYNIKYNSNQK